MKAWRVAVGVGALMLAPSAMARVCAVSIDSTDQMSFSSREIKVAADCTAVDLTLRHTGKLADRLVSRIRIGSMHLDQTLTLHDEDDESGPRTRVGMKIVATNSIAVIGEVVPRLDVQKLVIEYVDTTLRQVQKHCEADA